MNRCWPLLCACAIALCGCASIKQIILPESAAASPRNLALRIHAAARLNTDRDGKSVAVVTRFFHLRQHTAFNQASFDTFLSPARERDALGADLLDVKEVVLIPGQKYEVSEKVSREAGYIGVVALFHAPAPQRWRLVFNAAEAEKRGITIGAHSCALSNGVGATALGTGSVRTLAHCQ